MPRGLGESRGSDDDARAVLTSWWARVLLGTVGAGVLVAGAVGAFASDNGAGIAALIAVGSALLVLAVLGDVVSISAAGIFSVERRRVADAHKERAEELERGGDASGAQQEWREALKFTNPISEWATAYEAVRRHVPPGDERTEMFDRLADVAYKFGSGLQPELASVQKHFDDASEGERFATLAALLADPKSARPAAVIGAIDDSRSAAEQYEALQVADVAWSNWSERDQYRLAEVVQAQLGPGGWIRSEGARRDTATAILEGIAAASSTHDE